MYTYKGQIQKEREKEIEDPKENIKKVLTTFR